MSSVNNYNLVNPLYVIPTRDLTTEGKEDEVKANKSESALKEYEDALKEFLHPSPKVNKVAIPAIAFGKEMWEKHFDKWDKNLELIHEEPPLPANIEQILSARCPFWPDKTVRETHILTLIPAKVNASPFNLNLLPYLSKYPKIGTPTDYSHYDENIKEPYGEVLIYRSYWILMTHDVIPGSRSLSYEEQLKIASKYQDYEIPHLLDAAVSIVMEKVSTGTSLFDSDRDPETFTVCQEKMKSPWSSEEYQIAVGGFSKRGFGRGLHFSHTYNEGDEPYGFALCRKL